MCHWTTGKSPHSPALAGSSPCSLISDCPSEFIPLVTWPHPTAASHYMENKVQTPTSSPSPGLCALAWSAPACFCGPSSCRYLLQRRTPDIHTAHLQAFLHMPFLPRSSLCSIRMVSPWPRLKEHLLPDILHPISLFPCLPSMSLPAAPFLENASAGWGRPPPAQGLGGVRFEWLNHPTALQ